MAAASSPDSSPFGARRLPDDPSIEHLRGQARALQRAARAGDAAALDWIGRLHPDAAAVLANLERVPLSAAQLVVARGYGLASWPALVDRLKVIAAYRRDPDATPAAQPASGAPGGSPTGDDIARLACLTYSEHDDPARWAEADRLIREHPDVVRGDIWTSAAASDVDGVRRWIERDSSLAHREGGPHRWTPLMYLAYSRVARAAEETSVLGAARALLRAGADPDAGYLWHGLTTPFTALTGAFGEGEQGPGRQPRHPLSPTLARLLLEAGADPNDGQTLYNRMFRPDDSHLRLLFEYGLGRVTGGRWSALLGNSLETPQQGLRRVLRWALAHDFDDRVELLAAHGVDVLAPFEDGQRPIDLAVRRGNRRLAARLRAAGAEEPALDEAAQLIAAVLGGREGDALSLLRQHPAAASAARSERPALIQEACSPAAVRCALAAGFAVGAPDESGATALHHAAWRDDAALVDALLACGADPAAREPVHGGTALDWARHSVAASTIARLSAARTS